MERRTARQTARLHLETLEDRLTPTPTLNIADGTLTIPGRNNVYRGDNVRVLSTGSNILVLENNVLTWTGSAASVTKIVFNGLAGNDVFTAAGVNKPVTANGGAGNDILVGGISANTLNGGLHNDILVGTRFAVDTFNGGGGLDTCFVNIVDTEVFVGTFYRRIDI